MLLGWLIDVGHTLKSLYLGVPGLTRELSDFAAATHQTNENWLYVGFRAVVNIIWHAGKKTRPYKAVGSSM